MTVKIHGSEPFSVAVVHGGPGAPGTVAPVARELSHHFGVLEPLQTADSLDGQIEELARDLKAHGTPPITLVGWSWGAMLSLLVAAHYPHLVKKLILVSSGPLAEEDAHSIMETRLQRLSDAEKGRFERCLAAWSEGLEVGDEIMTLLDKADSYAPIAHEKEARAPQPTIYQKVWGEAAAFRQKGGFVSLVEQIRCPVTVIHGDYDPHPAEGIRRPLASLKDFRFVLLKQCGHTPWYEKAAYAPFFNLLLEEIG